jgi:hypothetical protein
MTTHKKRSPYFGDGETSALACATPELALRRQMQTGCSAITLREVVALFVAGSYWLTRHLARHWDGFAPARTASCQRVALGALAAGRFLPFFNHSLVGRSRVALG